MGVYKGEMEIGKFCVTEKKSADSLKEESLVLSFKTDFAADGFDNPCDLLGMSPGQVSALIGDHDKAGIIVTGFTGQKKGVYNITIKGYEFIGNTFSSFEVKRVKKVGTIIILLRVRLRYDKKFHEQYPRFIDDVLDIEIAEVNEQLPIPESGTEETPEQDSQPNKLGRKYSLGQICKDDSCEEPVRNDSKTGRCKAHLKK